MEKVKLDSMADAARVIKEKEQQGLVLSEVHNHTDGDFLLFRDPAEQDPARVDALASIKKRLDALEGDVATLKKAGKT